ncbi:hypothetical protein NUSPORA_02378 [Nucleospora cyclopteri]
MFYFKNDYYGVFFNNETSNTVQKKSFERGLPNQQFALYTSSNLYKNCGDNLFLDNKCLLKEVNINQNKPFNNKTTFNEKKNQTEQILIGKTKNTENILKNTNNQKNVKIKSKKLFTTKKPIKKCIKLADHQLDLIKKSNIMKNQFRTISIKILFLLKTQINFHKQLFPYNYRRIEYSNLPSIKKSFHSNETPINIAFTNLKNLSIKQNLSKSIQSGNFCLKNFNTDKSEHTQKKYRNISQNVLNLTENNKPDVFLCHNDLKNCAELKKSKSQNPGKTKVEIFKEFYDTSILNTYNFNKPNPKEITQLNSHKKHTNNYNLELIIQNKSNFYNKDKQHSLETKYQCNKVETIQPSIKPESFCSKMSTYPLYRINKKNNTELVEPHPSDVHYYGVLSGKKSDCIDIYDSEDNYEDEDLTPSSNRIFKPSLFEKKKHIPFHKNANLIDIFNDEKDFLQINWITLKNSKNDIKILPEGLSFSPGWRPHKIFHKKMLTNRKKDFFLLQICKTYKLKYHFSIIFNMIRVNTFSKKNNFISFEICYHLICHHFCTVFNLGLGINCKIYKRSKFRGFINNKNYHKLFKTKKYWVDKAIFLHEKAKKRALRDFQITRSSFTPKHLYNFLIFLAGHNSSTIAFVSYVYHATIFSEIDFNLEWVDQEKRSLVIEKRKILTIIIEKYSKYMDSAKKILNYRLKWNNKM